MPDQPGKKAELDKDGISLGKDNAELDKEGITLSEAIDDDDSQNEGTQHADLKESAHGANGHKKIIVIASVLGIFVIISAGVLWFGLHKETSASGTPAYTATPVVEAVYTPEGDIILDPFMILYDTQNSNESGVLLAQLSLQITPGTAANIESSIFDIRSLILDRLSTNARIYSKNELAEILKEDLQRFKVQDVAFIQYEQR